MEVEYLTNRYAAEQQAIDQMMVEKLLEAEAKSRGLAGIEELLNHTCWRDVVVAVLADER